MKITQADRDKWLRRGETNIYSTGKFWCASSPRPWYVIFAKTKLAAVNKAIRAERKKK